MKIADIETGKDVVSVTGVVRNVWNLRDGHSAAAENMQQSNATEESGAEESMFTDDGPLSSTAKRVFSLSMYSFRGDSSRQREKMIEVMLYFYDTWAEKCSFCSSGDILTISGPASMVREARVEEKDDFPHCLIFSDQPLPPLHPVKQAGGALLTQLLVESKNINTTTRQFELTSASLMTTSPPPLIDWNAVRKLSKQKTAKAPSSSSKPAAKAITAPRPPQGAAVRATSCSKPLPSLAYTYTPLRDISGPDHIGELVNIYGVVHSYQQPKSTRGSHKYSCSYSLIDPSCVPTTPSLSTEPSPSVLQVVLVFFC